MYDSNEFDVSTTGTESEIRMFHCPVHGFDFEHWLCILAGFLTRQAIISVSYMYLMWRRTKCPRHTNDSVFYLEIKCQLDATEVFIADLIACSSCFGHLYAHHQDLKSIIQWLLPVVFRAVVLKLLLWCGAEGYVSGLQDAAASCKPDT